MKNMASRYGLPVLLFFSFALFFIKCFAKPRIPSMPALNYFVGYDTGFGGRKLIGTIFGWMLPEYATADSLLPITLTACVLIALLFVLLVWKAVPRLDKPSVPFVALTVVFLLSPYGVVKWFKSALAPLFMETHQIVLVLAWCVLFVRCRKTLFYYPATLIIAAAGILIHHTFCCTLFPLMAAMFVYDILSEERPQRGKIVAYGLISLVLLLIFVAIWRFSEMNIDFETLCQRLSKRIDPNIILGWDEEGQGTRAVKYYYYMTNAENRAMNEELLGILRIDLAFTVLLLSPLIAIFWYPWISAARATRDKPWVSVRYILILLVSTLLTVPVFFMATDYSRWLFCYFLCQYLLLTLMTITDDKPIKGALLRLWLFAKRYWYLSAAVVTWLTFFVHNTAWDGLYEAIALRNFVLGIQM